MLDDDVEQAVLDIAGAILEGAVLDDDSYAHAVGIIGEAELVELTTLVGYYGILASLMHLFRVPRCRPACPLSSGMETYDNWLPCRVVRERRSTFRDVGSSANTAHEYRRHRSTPRGAPAIGSDLGAVAADRHVAPRARVVA